MMVDDVTDGLLEAWFSDDVILRWSQNSELFQTQFSYDYISGQDQTRWCQHELGHIDDVVAHELWPFVWLYKVKDSH